VARGVDGDELAHRTETIRRSDCAAVAEYAFREPSGSAGGLRRAEVDGQPVYEGC
jgi:hypothetical protein